MFKITTFAALMALSFTANAQYQFSHISLSKESVKQDSVKGHGLRLQGLKPIREKFFLSGFYNKTDFSSRERTDQKMGVDIGVYNNGEKDIQVFAHAGILSQTNDFYYIEEKDTGFTVGLGFNYQFGEQWELFYDFIHAEIFDGSNRTSDLKLMFNLSDQYSLSGSYYEDDETNSIGFGVKYYFGM